MMGSHCTASLWALQSRTRTWHPATSSSQQSWHDSCALLPSAAEIEGRRAEHRGPSGLRVARLRTRLQTAPKRLRASSPPGAEGDLKAPTEGVTLEQRPTRGQVS